MEDILTLEREREEITRIRTYERASYKANLAQAGVHYEYRLLASNIMERYRKNKIPLEKKTALMVSALNKLKGKINLNSLNDETRKRVLETYGESGLNRLRMIQDYVRANDIKTTLENLSELDGGQLREEIYRLQRSQKKFQESVGIDINKIEIRS